MTVASNEYQTQAQLLRHGMLSWVTRGVYLGYQRNYLEMQVDDVFLPDDRWNTDTNSTPCDPLTYDPVACPNTQPIRMTPAEVERALTWQRDNKAAFSSKL